MRGWALAALLALAACGRSDFVVTPDLRPSLDRAALEELGEPVMLLEVPALGAATLTRIRARNGNAVTWATVDERTVTLEDGLLIATRGLGPDLMSADPGDTRARLARGGTDWAPRFLSWLDGEDQPVFATLLCRVEERRLETLDILGERVRTTRITERCKSPEYAVANTYWLGPEGTIRKSRQWAGPDLGSITVERLIR